MQPGGIAWGFPEPLDVTPAVQRSVDEGVWMGVLLAAGAGLCEVAPPGDTRPHAVTSQAHPHRMISNFLMSSYDDDTT